MDADGELPGPSGLYQLTPRGKRWLEAGANEEVLPEHLYSCRCKSMKRKQRKPKRKPKGGNSKKSPLPKVKSKRALRRQLIREKRAARKRAAKM